MGLWPETNTPTCLKRSRASAARDGIITLAFSLVYTGREGGGGVYLMKLATLQHLVSTAAHTNQTIAVSHSLRDRDKGVQLVTICNCPKVVKCTLDSRTD